jgi:hypothetical protein
VRILRWVCMSKNKLFLCRCGWRVAPQCEFCGGCVCQRINYFFVGVGGATRHSANFSVCVYVKE